MKDSLPESDRLLELVRSVSSDLPAHAESLFEEDPGSLRMYLRSDSFWEELFSTPSPVEIEADVFFILLFERFRRKMKTDDEFRREFSRSVHESSDQQWDLDRTRRFLNDDQLLGYLTRMLNRFVQTEGVYQLPLEDDSRRYRYIVDMLRTSLDRSDQESFQIYCHIGNYTLFLTGVFPEWVRYRHEYKNRPMNLDSYRNYGKAYYERAAKHDMADRWELKDVLSKLSWGYDPVRAMLNLIFDRLLPAFD